MAIDPSSPQNPITGEPPDAAVNTGGTASNNPSQAEGPKTGTAGSEGSDEPVTFTPKQQERIDELVSDAYRRAESKFGDRLRKLEQQASNGSNGNAATEPPKPEKDKKTYTADEVALLQQQQAEQVRILEERFKSDRTGQAKQTLRERALIAAMRANAIDAETFVDLAMLRGWIDIDPETGEVELNPPNGVNRIGDRGEQVELDEYFTRILDTTPYLRNTPTEVVATQTPGGGVGGRPLSLANMSPEEQIRLSEQEPEKYQGLVRNQLGTAGQVKSPFQ